MQIDTNCVHPLRLLLEFYIGLNTDQVFFWIKYFVIETFKNVKVREGRENGTEMKT